MEFQNKFKSLIFGLCFRFISLFIFSENAVRIFQRYCLYKQKYFSKFQRNQKIILRITETMLRSSNFSLRIVTSEYFFFMKEKLSNQVGGLI